VPCMIKGQYVIRFTITSQRTTVQDLTRDWNQIRSTATDVLEEAGVVTTNRKRVPLKEIKEKNESFGTSLLLANIGPNSPLTPKIVDGSFAALFNDDDVVVDFSKKLKTMQRDCSLPSIFCSEACTSQQGGRTITMNPISIWGPRIPLAIATAGAPKRNRIAKGGQQFSLDGSIDNIENEPGDSLRGRSLSVVEHCGMGEMESVLRKAQTDQTAILETEAEDVITTTLLQPHQTSSIALKIQQLDSDILNGGNTEEQIRETFFEVYKLFDDFGIIDKNKYLNINNEIKV